MARQCPRNEVMSPRHQDGVLCHSAAHRPAPAPSVTRQRLQLWPQETFARLLCPGPEAAPVQSTPVHPTCRPASNIRPPVDWLSPRPNYPPRPDCPPRPRCPRGLTVPHGLLPPFASGTGLASSCLRFFAPVCLSRDTGSPWGRGLALSCPRLPRLCLAHHRCPINIDE